MQKITFGVATIVCLPIVLISDECHKLDLTLVSGLISFLSGIFFNCPLLEANLWKK